MQNAGDFILVPGVFFLLPPPRHMHIFRDLYSPCDAWRFLILHENVGIRCFIKYLYVYHVYASPQTHVRTYIFY